MSGIDENVQRLITPVVQSMQPYHVPDATGYLKLDAMENPYVWDDATRQKWLDVIRSAEINRYPSPSADLLRGRIIDVMNIPAGLDVMLGNGSDEIIQILAMALMTGKASMLSLEPAFVMYKIIAGTLGMAYHPVSLREDFTLDLVAVLDSVRKYQPSLLFFAVPNNPTGNCFAESDLRKVIEVSQGLVVIDEAYMAFTTSNLLQLAIDYDNVVIMRTLSKVGLAGLRLGMLVGKTAWIEQFNKIRLPYNINVLTQLTAVFALEHYGILQQQAGAIKTERDELASLMRGLAGAEVFESQANFLLIRTAKDAKAVFEKLKEQRVLVKCLSGSHPLLHNCLRITVGTASENKRLLSALKASLQVS